MDIRNVCIIGGSGFVGASVADHAVAKGKRVRVVTRSAPRARRLAVLPTCEILVADPNDDASLARAVEGMDAVINLVGIIHEAGRSTFKSAHVDLPRRISKACRAQGVRQVVHMSALGASATGPSEYLRSKGEGETALAETSDAPWTIFRPSVIFGEHDRFINLFAQLARIFPVIPLGGAQARFQPIWVEDVARAFVASLGDPRTFRQTYELCGPKVYTLEELVRLAAAAAGQKTRIVPLPGSVASLQALVFEHLPGALLTRDNLKSMSVDNVCSGPFPALFGFQPSPLEAVVPEYMSGRSSRAKYNRFRHQAGR
jgi:uncharacterized protein YbjT (DUF2867 family)